MSKQTLTVDLDVPEGYELTGELRLPKRGETILCPKEVVKYIYTDHITDMCPLLRKVWKPPAWLPNGCWVYRFCDDWYVSTTEPQSCDSGKSYRSPCNFGMLELVRLFGGEFVPPSVNNIQVKH